MPTQLPNEAISPWLLCFQFLHLSNYFIDNDSLHSNIAYNMAEWLRAWDTLAMLKPWNAGSRELESRPGYQSGLSFLSNHATSTGFLI